MPRELPGGPKDDDEKYPMNVKIIRDRCFHLSELGLELTALAFAPVQDQAAMKALQSQMVWHVEDLGKWVDDDYGQP